MEEPPDGHLVQVDPQADQGLKDGPKQQTKKHT